VDAVEFRRRLDDRAVAAGVPLTDEVVHRLQAYFDLLARWNRTINLTSLPLARPSVETIDRLLIEPLVVARFLDDAPLRWIDLGSGGGSPAIPMKIYRPSLRLTMVESRTRKASFLREAIRVLQLGETVVENVRINELAGREELRSAVDVITARGVRVDVEFLSACRAMCKPRARLVVFGSHALSPGSGFAPMGIPWFFERCST
jgi:16S rRNA (guanine527-N7)-methyltransferase